MIEVPAVFSQEGLQIVFYPIRLKLQNWKAGPHEDRLTTAVAKWGWWLNSKDSFSDGSREPPTRQSKPRAMLLCSATCSILRSSDSLSGSSEKLPFTSFAILCASLKWLYIASVWSEWLWKKDKKDESDCKEKYMQKWNTIRIHTHRKGHILSWSFKWLIRDVIRDSSVLQKLKVLKKSLRQVQKNEKKRQ